MWEFEVPLFGQKPRGGHGPEAWGNQAFAAVRLGNGNTLISSGNGYGSPTGFFVIEVSVRGGGEDGTGLIREFLSAAPRYLLPGGGVVVETAHSQGATVAGLARAAFPSASVEVRKDLAGYDRIVVVKT